MLRLLLGTGLLSLAVITGSVKAQPWSFTVLSDPLGMACSYRKALREIRDMTVDSTPKLPKTEFVVVNGDIGGIQSRMRIFRNIFRKDPVMKAIFPVIGNHESPKQKETIIQRVIPSLDSVHTVDPQAAHYCVDWKNVRILIFNQYTSEAMHGCLDLKATRWAAERIEEARMETRLDHVFAFMHEPAFPRHRHLDDSFNKCIPERNQFWQVMVANRDLVRAVFNGHTHTYSKIMVADPESGEANNPAMVPLQHNGVYQIDSGAAGQGKRVTVVRITINGKSVSGRTVEAKEHWGSKFELIDEWLF